jgi:hypothetical protein
MRPHRAAACCGAAWAHAITCGMEVLLPMPPGVSAQTGRVPSPRALAAAARLPPTLCPVWIKGRRATHFNMGPGGCCTVEIEFGFSARTKICTKLINVYNRFSQRTRQQASRRAPWWTTDCKPTSLSHADRLACAALVVMPA